MKINAAALRPAESDPFKLEHGEHIPTKAEREAAEVRASYLVSDTTPSKVDLSVKDMPGTSLLEVTQIDTYDGDPRLFANEKAEDIEGSIRANGFYEALVVTRRRDSERFMLAAGSNTTLRILKRLYTETQDEKYRWVNCIFQLL